MELTNSVAVLYEDVFTNENKSLWVFAYGSLCWKPGFDFHKAVKGHVQGFHRRFWQGNCTHRGTEERPGRVATLVEDTKGVVHGIAFELKGEAAIPYLSKRECDLGGYVSNFTTFYPAKGESFKVLLYMATPSNPLWLGDAHVNEITDQIVNSCGPSGHNVEYVLRLANFMNHHFPDHNDRHLTDLEQRILEKIQLEQLCLITLMGNGEGCITFIKQDRHNLSDNNNQADVEERIESFEHTTRVPEKLLRCLNI